MKNAVKFLVYFFISCNGYAQKYSGELAEKEYGIPANKLDNLFQVIETKQKFIDFIGIKKGSVVAEIGSEDGVAIGILSTIYDSVTFYAQDINEKALSQSRLDKTMKQYLKYRKLPQTNTIKRIIGTETATKLPDATFDVILIRFSFHDFDKKDEMLDDIYSKLKPTGRLVIDDGNSFPNDTLKCTEYGCHVFLTLDEEIKLFEKHGLYVTHIRNPDFHASHYGNLLVFEKSKSISDDFFKRKNAIDPLVKRSFRLNQIGIATDSIAVKQIADSLFSEIKEISVVYEEYDVWLKEMALKYLRKGRNQAAINILKLDFQLYPELYQTSYWLGVAYQENKQYDLALKYLQYSLSIDAKNKNAIERIKAIEKVTKKQKPIGFSLSL